MLQISWRLQSLQSHIMKKLQLPKQLFNCKSHSVRVSASYKKQSCNYKN